MEVEMVAREHPFVVLSKSVFELLKCAQLERTMDIEREKRYHRPMRMALKIILRMTLRSASLASSFEMPPPPAMRESSASRRFFLCRCFCLSFPVNPVSSSASTSDPIGPNSCSSESDIKEPESLSDPESFNSDSESVARRLYFRRGSIWEDSSLSGAAERGRRGVSLGAVSMGSPRRER